MESKYSRVRSRTTPPKWSGSKKIGTKSYFHKPSQTWIKLIDFTHQFTNPFDRAQITRDELHRRTKLSWIEGGPFKTLDMVYVSPSGISGWGTYYSILPGANGPNGGLERYQGGFVPAAGVSWFGSNAAYTLNNAYSLESSWYPEINSYRSAAWSRTVPKLSKVSVPVFIYELRDATKMLETSSSIFAKSYKILRGQSLAHTKSGLKHHWNTWRMPREVSDHFVNHHFGWAPFVGDIVKILSTILDAQAIIRKLSDENGKWVSRRATLVDTSSTSVTDSGTDIRVTPAFGNNWWSVQPRWTLEITEKLLVTTKGKFRYYRTEFDKGLAEHNSTISTVLRYVKLFGLEIDPLTIYRVIPWSWLVGWLTNFNNYVERLNSQLMDATAAKYLYLMEHKMTELSFTQNLPFGSGTLALKFSRSVETKQREEADTPYGFDLGSPLSATQIAILTALGLLRVKAK